MLLKRTGVVDLLARGGVQLLGFRGREAQLPEQVRASLRDVADFDVDRYRLPFLALTTARQRTAAMSLSCFDAACVFFWKQRRT